eukprot:jgi/Picre1/32428/NNA_007774.t1
MTASVLQRLGSVDDCLVATLKRKGLGRWCVFTQGTQQVQGRYFGRLGGYWMGRRVAYQRKKRRMKVYDLFLWGVATWVGHAGQAAGCLEGWEIAFQSQEIQSTLENLEHMQHELLEAQAATLHIDHEKNITRERVKRQEVLDSARIQLDSLLWLYPAVGKSQEESRSHKMSSAVFHIRDALDMAGIFQHQ